MILVPIEIGLKKQLKTSPLTDMVPFQNPTKTATMKLPLMSRGKKGKINAKN